MIKKLAVFAFAILSLMVSAFSQEPGVTPDVGPHGLIPGSDKAVLGELEKRVRAAYSVDIDRYYTVAIDDGETYTESRRMSLPFALWIPEKWREYLIELQYANGQSVYKESNVAQPITVIMGPEEGGLLIIKITRRVE